MYEIIRVGVPARKQDTTQSFLDVINNIKTDPTCIGILTVDLNKPETQFEFNSAPYGYSYIINNLEQKFVSDELKTNVINVYPHIWEIHGGKTQELSVDNFLNYLDDQYKLFGFKRVYLFTCGSPFIYDMLSGIILNKRPMHIIDCESPIKICANNMKHFLGIESYVIHMTIPDNLQKQTLHIFPSISENYGINVDEYFIILSRMLSENDKFIYCNILNDGSSLLKCTSVSDAFNNINILKNNTIFTLGIYKL
jgi:hypothetical protein